ncbi:HAMP domain-containing protein [Massilia forsythiae]|uniref:HAMP domain-containing protein n=1 Tax=Massilia forsythiae TaxID=2728020 RepID=A0A7Z2ZTX2_9BURK|nr:methyl-accepting chemotaxis protein [Massilia forsythiae]QJE01720.1 HAMP domain-containing protein [Massilia forsythiae]
MLSRLRIGPKLLLAPGAVLLLLVLLSCGAYMAMVRQNQSLDTIVQQRAVHMRAAFDLVASAQRAHAQAYQVLTWISGSFPRARVEPLVRDVQLQQGAVKRGFAALSHLARGSPGEQRYIDQAQRAWLLYVAAVGDVLELAQNDQSVSATAMVKAERAFAVVAQRLTELSQREQELSELASTGAATDFKTISTLMPLVIALSIAASLAITMAVRRSLLGEIGAIEAAVHGLASGDLTTRPREYGRDEIAATSRALDASIRNLNGTLRTILESARSIGLASREITLGRAALPARAGVRASLEHTAASMQELAAAMHSSADSVQHANRVTESASLAAQEGGSVVHRLVATLESVRRSAGRMEEINDAVETILGNAGTLALNAAVEAAKAGEQGQGFAQAACELRTLARRAGAAAHEARDLARQAVATIENGRAWAAQAGTSMADLASSVQEVGDIVNRMGDASAERAQELAGVNQAIVRMDEMTLQGSRMVEEAAVAARSLQQQALTLSRAVAAFRLDEATGAEEGEIGEKVCGLAGTPGKRPGEPGHPYLRLASSRGQVR